MKKIKLISRIAAAAITACMLFSNQPWTFAAAEVKQDKELAVQYVSEVKMFYAATEEEAREACQKEGYTFCPENLNEGAGKNDSDAYTFSVMQRETGEWSTKIYLGYKTTDDPDDAITDMSLLDMKNSHYEKMTYLEYLDKYAGEFSQDANSIMLMVNGFREQYRKGTPNALLAYDSLNLIYIDENKPSDSPENQMGYYLINKADATFFQKYLQRGNAKILGAIVDLLGSAVSDVREDGKTWVDRSKSSEIPKMYADAASDDRSIYDAMFRDSAFKLLESVRDFSTIYHEARSLYDQYGETFGYEQLSADSTIEDMMELGSECRHPEYSNALRTYMLLDAYPYQQAGETVVSNAVLLSEKGEEMDAAELTVEYQEEKSLADVLLELAEDPNIDNHPEQLYPFVQYMTTAQITLLSLCGLGKLAEGLYMAPEMSPSERRDLIQERMAKIRSEGFENGRIYLWLGVDNSMFSKKVVETSKAIEVRLSGDEYMDSLNAQARAENNKLSTVLGYIEITQMIFSAVYSVVSAFVGSLLTLGMNCFMAAGVTLSLGITAASVATAATSVVIGAFMCVMWALNVLAVVVSIGLFIYQILDWTGALRPRTETVDYSTIPDMVFNAVDTQGGVSYRLKYDSVHSSGFKNYRLVGIASLDDDLPDDLDNYADMNAFLSSHDRWITLYTTKCAEAGEPIALEPGQSLLVTQDNYQAPEGYRPLALFNEISAVDINDVAVLGKTGDPLYVFFPGKSDRILSAKHSDAKTFVSDVYLSYGDNQQDALNVLKKGGYTIINENLTDGHGYAYLGYMTTSESKYALTDLRVSTAGTEAIAFGGANYVRKDPKGKNSMTKDGLALYFTKDLCAGTPITDIKVYDHRLPLGSGPEPVCLFSGGNAVDFQGLWSDNMLYNEVTSMYEFFIGIGASSYAWQPPEAMVRQDDPVKGKYIYFWPQDQYIAENPNAQAPYVAGFSYFLAAHDKTGDNRYGTNYEFMQKFAKENGFELLMDGAEPFRAMTSEANEMTVTTYMVEAEGTPTLTYHYGLIHGYSKGMVWQASDGGALIAIQHFKSGYHLSRESKNYLTYHPAMYFGISYTFNPYRAITGVSALVTAYTEKSTSIRTTGISTPAGGMQVCNVSMQGYPINNAGIAYGYVNPYLPMAFYTNYDAKQKSDLEWMTDQETEIHDRYLMTIGPKKDMLPIKRDEIMFQMTANPETPAGYVPLCDLRTPGDYSHPFNLALETTNFGSKYLYLYLSKNAGGRKGEAPNAHNVYHKKKYVAGVFCGSGSTPDEAIAHLYSQANKQWATLAKDYGDINANPVVMEFDEIIPDDLESKIPWYKMEVHDGVANCSLPSGEYLCSNDEAHNRWFYNAVNDYNKKVFDKAADREEWGPTCAYIGVVRTDSKPDSTKSPIYGLVKYYSDTTYTGEPTPPSTLKVGATTCTLAGDPVIDWNSHTYYSLYYTTNPAGGAYSAPVTDIKISDEIFESGYNPTVVVRESQRVNYQLPQYYDLRKSAYEFRHIHLGYDRTDLPYIEGLFLGVGKTKEEAYADLIGTSSAYGMIDVDCNYNSYSDQWIAVGYRRTASKTEAIHDVFLYYGDDPQDTITIQDGYWIETVAKGRGPKTYYTYERHACTSQNVITYKLLKHDLKTEGTENISLTKGNGGKGLYLYYSKNAMSRTPDPESDILPIKNLCFTYGDISPKYATEKDAQSIYKNSYIGSKVFNASDYANLNWECVLGVNDPLSWKIDGSAGQRMSLNEGILPGKGNSAWHGSDNRVFMYVDRAKEYRIRPNAELPDFGYYSEKSDYGVLKQAS